MDLREGQGVDYSFLFSIFFFSSFYFLQVVRDGERVGELGINGGFWVLYGAYPFLFFSHAIHKKTGGNRGRRFVAV